MSDRQPFGTTAMTFAMQPLSGCGLAQSQYAAPGFESIIAGGGPSVDGDSEARDRNSPRR